VPRLAKNEGPAGKATQSIKGRFLKQLKIYSKFVLKLLF
jgi:hypothetical protein